MKRIGYIDARRAVVGGVHGWSGVPALLIPGQGQGFGIFEDFFQSTELAAALEPTGWELDVFGGGGAFTTADLAGGVALIQTAGGDNDAIQFTLGSLDGGTFWPRAGHDIWFETFLKLSPATEIIAAIGLQDPSALVYMGNAGAGPAVNNHLLFTVVDGGVGVAESWHFVGNNAGVIDSNDLSVALANLTWIKLGFHVVGVTRVDVLVNDVVIAAGEVATASIPITGLMPCVCLKAGAAAVQAHYVDYIMCVQRR